MFKYVEVELREPLENRQLKIFTDNIFGLNYSDNLGSKL